MEAPFLNAVVMIATGAAVIKFALFEWEGVARAWRRVRGPRKSRPAARNTPRRALGNSPR